MVYKIRVIADLADQDVFRGFYILPNQSFEELDNAIVDAFDLYVMQMASFYLSLEKGDLSYWIDDIDLN